MPSDRSVLIRIKGDAGSLVRAVALSKAAVSSLRREIRDMGEDINKSNDRTAWLAQGILALAPAATTLGAGAIPAISGLVTQMTVAGAAAGVMALGFNGIGDALGALNDYQLDPTEAHLAKMEEAMAKVGAEGAKFVQFLDSLGPQFSELANISREGMFPGITDGIEDFMTLMPRFRNIVSELAQGVGTLGADMGAGLAGDDWTSFWSFLENDARPILVEMGRTLGNFAEGIGNMVVAFLPLSQSFSSGLLDMSRSFAEWSANLTSSTGFREFVEYVRSAAPQALDFLGSLSMAFAEILEAAAPVGSVALPALTKLLDVIAELADTPLGPLTLGLAALTSAYGRLAAIGELTGSGFLARATSGMRNNLATAKMLRPTMSDLGTSLLFAAHSQDALKSSLMSGSKAASTSATKALQAKTQMAAFGKSVAPVAGQVGLLGFAASGLASNVGLSNTATLALAGSLAGPWGAAVAGGIGLMMDFAAVNNDAASAIQSTGDAITAAFSQEAGTVNMSALEAQYEASVRKVDELAKAIRTEPVAGAKEMFGDLLPWVDDYETQYDLMIAQRTRLQELRERESGATAGVAAATAYQKSIEAETAAIQANIDAMREKRSLALAGMNAELGYQSAILDAKDSLEENGKTLDKHTRAGIANRQALYGMAAAWNAQNEAAKAAPGAHRAAIRTFVDMAVKMGMSRVQARRLARSLFEIPTHVGTTVEARTAAAEANVKAIQRLVNKYGLTRAEATALLKDAVTGKIKNAQDLVDKYGMTKAEAKALLDDLASGRLERLIALMRAVDGMTAKTTTTHEIITQYRVVRSVTDATAPKTRGYGIHEAAGGILDAYAGGGMRDPYDRRNAHPPHIAPAGTYRMFAEAETGGEAYIPLAGDWRRPRAISIWEETGRRLGLEFQRFAEGGLRAPVYSAPAATSVTVKGGGLSDSDITRLARAVRDGALAGTSGVPRQMAGVANGALNDRENRWRDLDG